MSGYKHATVTISQEEYRRLHEADMKKRFREFANINSQNSSQDREVNAILQQERANYQYRVQEILARQDAYLQNESTKEETARQWVNHCIGLIELIQYQYDHERFAPDRLNRIIRNLNMAECNLNDGFNEASLQSAQQNYLELSDLQFELEQSIFHWKTEFEKTYFTILALVNEMGSNASVNALGLQGEELPNAVDLDYWTNGRYQQLLDHCRQYALFMSKNQERLSMADIDRIYNQIIPMIRDSFESIVYEARLSALNSQLRMNIAETALQALEHHGFRLEQSGYTDSDMRSEFNAHLNCIDGTQVSIQVMPTGRENEELTNELVVITTHPNLKTEHEARLRWEELNQALNLFNLNVSRPEILPLPASLSPGHSEYTQPLEQKFTRSER